MTSGPGSLLPGPDVTPRVDTSSAGVGFHSPGAAFYWNAAAASLEYSFLHSGDNDQAAATTLGADLTLGRTHLDASSASMQAEIAADRARVDAAAASFRIHVAANVVDPNRTSAAGSVNAARDTRRG